MLSTTYEGAAGALKGDRPANDARVEAWCCEAGVAKDDLAYGAPPVDEHGAKRVWYEDGRIPRTDATESALAAPTDGALKRTWADGKVVASSGLGLDANGTPLVVCHGFERTMGSDGKLVCFGCPARAPAGTPQVHAVFTLSAGSGGRSCVCGLPQPAADTDHLVGDQNENGPLAGFRGGVFDGTTETEHGREYNAYKLVGAVNKKKLPFDEDGAQAWIAKSTSFDDRVRRGVAREVLLEAKDFKGMADLDQLACARQITFANDRNALLRWGKSTALLQAVCQQPQDAEFEDAVRNQNSVFNRKYEKITRPLLTYEMLPMAYGLLSALLFDPFELELAKGKGDLAGTAATDVVLIVRACWSEKPFVVDRADGRECDPYHHWLREYGTRDPAGLDEAERAARQEDRVRRFEAWNRARPFEVNLGDKDAMKLGLQAEWLTRKSIEQQLKRLEGQEYLNAPPRAEVHAPHREADADSRPWRHEGYDEAHYALQTAAGCDETDGRGGMHVYEARFGTESHYHNKCTAGVEFRTAHLLRDNQILRGREGKVTARGDSAYLRACKDQAVVALKKPLPACLFAGADAPPTVVGVAETLDRDTSHEIMKLDAHLSPAARTAKLRELLYEKHAYTYVTKRQFEAEGRAELLQKEALEHDERATQCDEALKALLARAKGHEAHAQRQHAEEKAAAAARNDAAYANALHQRLAHEAAAVEAHAKARKFEKTLDEHRRRVVDLRVAAERWLDEGGVRNTPAACLAYQEMDARAAEAVEMELPKAEKLAEAALVVPVKDAQEEVERKRGSVMIGKAKSGAELAAAAAAKQAAKERAAGKARAAPVAAARAAPVVAARPPTQEERDARDENQLLEEFKRAVRCERNAPAGRPLPPLEAVAEQQRKMQRDVDAYGKQKTRDAKRLENTQADLDEAQYDAMNATGAFERVPHEVAEAKVQRRMGDEDARTSKFGLSGGRVLHNGLANRPLQQRTWKEDHVEKIEVLMAQLQKKPFNWSKGQLEALYREANAEADEAAVAVARDEAIRRVEGERLRLQAAEDEKARAAKRRAKACKSAVTRVESFEADTAAGEAAAAAGVPCDADMADVLPE